jgi:lysozyme family protein
MNDYPSRFINAVEKTLKNEGGYVNDPIDPGGETNYGISKRYWPAVDIKNLTREKAIDFYYTDFWLTGLAKEIDDENVAAKVFDLSVWFGKGGTNEVLRGVLLQLGTQSYELKYDYDLALGINKIHPTIALDLIRVFAVANRQNRVKKDPKLNKFLKGWIRRAEQ